ncbi:hypothetical protein PAN31117_05277 [Pandoraea anapnoica]|uniref:Uncharacterized protein n=1 Tax=Pandoraea anapnoica TaxID=2508301 RepID=A0A5E5AQ72_9BURK|nr:hypothetical protein PIN31009_05455 [Pandoraea iniqua]VVE75889.1 hypothetical protein PAN31117_05277 [Pandoraea anapnoica]
MEKSHSAPKCPDCGVLGIQHIVSTPSEQQSSAGDTWFEVAHCNSCGHVYGAFAKVVNRPTPIVRTKSLAMY